MKQQCSMKTLHNKRRKRNKANCNTDRQLMSTKLVTYIFFSFVVAAISYVLFSLNNLDVKCFLDDSLNRIYVY